MTTFRFECMDFDTYQIQAAKTAVYPRRGHNLEYPGLGLRSEAGEVAGKLKKLQRDHGGVITDDLRLAIAKELGDCLWYLAAICDEIDVCLGVVADMNIAKLAERQINQTIKGSGDHR